MTKPLNALTQWWHQTIATTIKPPYQDIETRCHALALRERIIVVVTALLILLVGVDTVLIAPAQQQLKTLHQKTTQLQLQQQSLSSQIHTLQQKINHDPNALLRQQRDDLKLKIGTLQRHIRDTTGQLIDPRHMPRLLAHLFSHQSGLTLLSVKSQPAEEVLLGDDETAQATGLYQHRLNLELRGSFKNIHRYLTRIENNAQQLYWNTLRYSVEEHPVALLQLDVQTLSTSKELIGVY